MVHKILSRWNRNLSIVKMIFLIRILIDNFMLFNGINKA